MKTPRLTRRELLLSAGVAAASPLLAKDSPETVTIPANAQEALQRLQEGNRRFVEGRTRHAHEGANWRKHLVGGQKPFATILGCADSRVPVELVFDQGFGDLFVVRVAGNVIAPDVIGSLAYAVAHLSTPLIVIVGHEGCGAVTAAVEALKGNTEEPPGIKALLQLIEPGLPKELPGKSNEEQVSAAVEANVRWSLSELAQLPEAQRAIAAGKVTLLGAVYDLRTGAVRFLPT